MSPRRLSRGWLRMQDVWVCAKHVPSPLLQILYLYDSANAAVADPDLSESACPWIIKAAASLMQSRRASSRTPVCARA